MFMSAKTLTASTVTTLGSFIVGAWLVRSGFTGTGLNEKPATLRSGLAVIRFSSLLGSHQHYEVQSLFRGVCREECVQVHPIKSGSMKGFFDFLHAIAVRLHFPN
jgi:hypothetical protein